MLNQKGFPHQILGVEYLEKLEGTSARFFTFSFDAHSSGVLLEQVERLFAHQMQISGPTVFSYLGGVFAKSKV